MTFLATEDDSMPDPGIEARVGIRDRRGQGFEKQTFVKHTPTGLTIVPSAMAGLLVG
jgi:hypothetical protein